MSATRVNLGFVPLVDAAPLLVAEALGFAGEEGLELALTAKPQRGVGIAGRSGPVGGACRGDRTRADRAHRDLCRWRIAAGSGFDRVSRRGRQFSMARSGLVDRQASGAAARAGPAARHRRRPCGVSNRPVPSASKPDRGCAAGCVGQTGGLAFGANRRAVAARSADSAAGSLLRCPNL